MNSGRTRLSITAFRMAGLVVVALAAQSCGGSFLCKMPLGSEAKEFKLLHHAATLRLEPDTHEVFLKDSVRFTGTLTRFELNSGLEIKRLEVGGRTIPLKRVTVNQPEEFGPRARTTYLMTCRLPEDGLLVLEAQGRFWQDPENVRFGHETVGNELSATVGPEGAWLAPEAALLPVFAEGELVPHRLHANLPDSWSLVTDGRLLKDERVGSRHLMTWEEPLPGGPLSIAAGPYDVRRELVDGVEISTWFFRRNPADGPFQGISGPVDDEQVRATLHRMTAYYLKMYHDLLGPYPFAKFAVVESFFPSGYGMPSWTLLGSQVIRMPYIPYTSLGHELLHNYWGNGVYVDAERGNWCEGLTVYDADYRYKVLEGPEPAREYRKNILKDYRSYVDDSRDQPLREFKNRHDGATRSLGYGKSMMVFHMLEQLLGQEALDRVKRSFYQTWAGRSATWDDFIAACEREGQMDLGRFKGQWLDRPGAPSLKLGELDWEGGRVVGSLEQVQAGAAQQPYELDIPILIECHDGTVLRERLLMDKARLELNLPCPEPRRIAIDPDFNLFRLLDGREMEPVISMVLAEETPLFVAPRAWLADSSRRAALDAFAISLREVTVPEWIAAEEFSASILGTRSVIAVNPPALPPGIEFVELGLNSEGWRLAGEQGAFSERSLVLAAKSATNDRKGVLLFWVAGPEQLPALARKVPHYGKYSYLAFDPAGTNVLKGNLTPRGNPLERRFGSW